MGLGASKRIEKTLTSSPEFTTACESVYAHCLSQAQHAFPGIRRYQLHDAAALIHTSLSASIPLIRRWVPSPPDQSQVDAALRRVDRDGVWEELGPDEFQAFAVELFRDAVLNGAGTAVLRRVPIGVVGIAAVGIATRSGTGLLAKVMGVYAVGVVASVYLCLA